MESVTTGKPINAQVGSLVRWTHPKGLTNGIVTEVVESGSEAFIAWFDHDGSGYYPLDHKWLVLLSK
jgi:hypothetical protein|tara:strand:- start:71 stop:271 length:201 start_codon:yes stop_codon:yes gene_type:complete